jgi:hypothetical protein
MAKSRIRSSEFGARSQSFRFTSLNSRPMTGVTSKEAYWSRTLESLRGSLGYWASDEVVVFVLWVCV